MTGPRQRQEMRRALSLKLRTCPMNKILWRTLGCAPRDGRSQAASLTVCRACWPSNYTGFRLCVVRDARLIQREQRRSRGPIEQRLKRFFGIDPEQRTASQLEHDLREVGRRADSHAAVRPGNG
jgi:hypothetical protein